MSICFEMNWILFSIPILFPILSLVQWSRVGFRFRFRYSVCIPVTIPSPVPTSVSVPIWFLLWIPVAILRIRLQSQFGALRILYLPNWLLVRGSLPVQCWLRQTNSSLTSTSTSVFLQQSSGMLSTCTWCERIRYRPSVVGQKNVTWYLTVLWHSDYTRQAGAVLDWCWAGLVLCGICYWYILVRICT